MLIKSEFTCSLIIDVSSDFIVKFNEDFEFTLTSQNPENDICILHVIDIKGDFEITKASYGDEIFPYDKENKTFLILKKYSWYTFHILADIEYKKVGHVCINYDLIFPADRLKLLKLHEYFEEYFVLPGYKNMKIKYYIKKNQERYSEIHIQNPLKVQIQERDKPASITSDDFCCIVDDSRAIDLKLNFIFDPINDDNLNQQSNVLTKSPNNALYEIMSNTDFADVVIFSSTNKEILTYRCVLAKYSTYFAKHIYESKEIPVKFTLKDDDTETIKAALDFCYGKIDSIIGKEVELFEFASKYGLDELKHACSTNFEKSVNPSNVCEMAEIAYSNNYENLKQKCNKILAEHKEKIDPDELEKLPKDVLIKIFFT